MYEIPYHEGNLSDKTFLVTGGAGFIGSNIVEYLLKYGAKTVRVLDNFSTGSHQNIDEFKSSSAFELIEGDIRDSDTCHRAVRGIDYVTHQAALGSVPRSVNDPITTNEVNVGGFLKMLVAARDAQVKRFIYAASSSTYGDLEELPKVESRIGNPISPYAVTKYVNELYAAVFSTIYNFHTVGLRYFNIFGPKQNPQGPYAAVIPLFIQAALRGEPPFINGDGETSRDFTFVENAIQVNIKALLSKSIQKHEVINVACGQRTTLNDLWEIIRVITSKDLKVKYQDARIGDVRHSLADISKAKELMHYQPIFSVKSGLEISFQWYTRNFYSKDGNKYDKI